MAALESQQAVIIDLRTRRRQRVADRALENGSMDVDSLEHIKVARPSKAAEGTEGWQTVEKQIDLAEVHARNSLRKAEDEECDL